MPLKRRSLLVTWKLISHRIQVRSRTLFPTATTTGLRPYAFKGAGQLGNDTMPARSSTSKKKWNQFYLSISYQGFLDLAVDESVKIFGLLRSHIEVEYSMYARQKCLMLMLTFIQQCCSCRWNSKPWKVNEVRQGFLFMVSNFGHM